MDRSITLGIVTASFLVLTCKSSSHTNYVVNAHNFSVTDDSSLLILIEQIKAETELVNAEKTMVVLMVLHMI